MVVPTGLRKGKREGKKEHIEKKNEEISLCFENEKLIHSN